MTRNKLLISIIALIALGSIATSLINFAVPLAIAVALTALIVKLLPEHVKSSLSKKSGLGKFEGLLLLFGINYFIGSSLYSALTPLLTAALPWVLVAGGVGLVVYAIKEAFVTNHPVEGYSYQAVDSYSSSQVFTETRNKKVKVKEKEPTVIQDVLKAMSFQSPLHR